MHDFNWQIPLIKPQNARRLTHLARSECRNKWNFGINLCSVALVSFRNFQETCQGHRHPNPNKAIQIAGEFSSVNLQDWKGAPHLPGLLVFWDATYLFLMLCIKQRGEGCTHPLATT